VKKKIVLVLLVGAFTLLGLGGWLFPNWAAQAAPELQLTPFPTPTPGADGRILYIVQENDTLWRISAITGVSLDDLRTLNRIGENDTILPGDVILLGMAGPEVITPTVGPAPTSEGISVTPTAHQGTGNLCVILYDDQNGDAVRQEEEPWITGGQVSVNDRAGTVSNTAETKPLFDEDGEISYYCFEDLPEASYNITVAVPEGYNPTTALSRELSLRGGEETFLAFGAQANTERIAETAVIPEAPRKSPLLAILGGLLLLGGVGLGIYAGLLTRRR
jgi:hypothetical protein